MRKKYDDMSEWISQDCMTVIYSRSKEARAWADKDGVQEAERARDAMKDGVAEQAEARLREQIEVPQDGIARHIDLSIELFEIGARR